MTDQPDANRPIFGSVFPTTIRPFYNVGALKLILMSTATFGLYDLVWLYRNWDVIRDRGQPDISPFWRAIFAPLWLFSLASNVYRRSSSDSSIVIGVAYLACNLAGRADSILWLASFFSVVPLVLLQREMASLNRFDELEDAQWHTLSPWDWAAFVPGSLLLILSAGGSFISGGAE